MTKEQEIMSPTENNRISKTEKITNIKIKGCKLGFSIHGPMMCTVHPMCSFYNNVPAYMMKNSCLISENTFY
jgi:hypothetical protein